MIALALVLQVQTQGPTQAPSVGDTIWITRTVEIAPRETVHPGTWQPPEPVEVVGPPRVTVRGSTAEIAYPVTVWRAGTHKIEIPGPLLLGPGGKADSLPPYVTTIDIRSVLPNVPADSTIAPQPRAEYVPRLIVSWWPLAVLLALAIILLVPLHWWWRRRGKSVALAPTVPRPMEPPVEQWAAAGERRTVISLGAARLRAAIGAAPDVARLDEDATALLAELDRARFGAETGEDALTLFRRAAAAAERVSRPS